MEDNDDKKEPNMDKNIKVNEKKELNKEKKKEKNEKNEPDLEKNLIINLKYRIIKKIGKGGFAKVYHVENIFDEKEYAMKVFFPGKDSVIIQKNIIKETKILKMLSGKNNSYVLKCYENGNFQSEDKINRYYFVINYAEKGDLYNYVKINNGLGEKFGKLIFKKILEGIQFCHDSNICHLDIKIANILLDDNYNPIINDFGISRIISLNNNNKEPIPMRGTKGTKYMMCPQMFEGDIYYGIDADIFALGVLLNELVFNERAFKQSDDDIYQDIKDKNYDKFWERSEKIEKEYGRSKEFKDLYVKMVSYLPKERPEIKDILNDPWLDEINVLIKYYPDEYKKLEQDFIKFMSGIKQKIDGTNHITVKSPQNQKKEEDKKIKTKAISSNKRKIFFGYNLVPKKLNTKRMFKYSIKILGNTNVVKFMNDLAYQISDIYEDRCLIEVTEDKLKFKIIIEESEIEIEKEEERIEQNKENEENKENEKDDKNQEVEEIEDEIEENDCIMEVKIFESGMDEYLLTFEKVKGELNTFYENFLKIQDIVKNMFE